MAHKVWANAVFHGAHAFQSLAVLIPSKVEVQLPTEDDAEADSNPSEPDETSPLFDRRRSSTYSTTISQSAKASASYISVSHVSRRWKRDYNLLIITFASWLQDIASVGIVTVKLLYAQQHFHWGTPELGGYMTAGALSRVLALTLILPMAIKLLHRPIRHVVLPQDHNAQHDLLDDEGRLSPRASRTVCQDDDHQVLQGSPHSPHLPPTDSEPAVEALTDTEREIEQGWTARATHLRLIYDSQFDLLVARASTILKMLCYLGLATAKSTEQFILWTCAACLGTGSDAAISSLSVALLQDPKDAGRFFGASSTLSAIAQTVVSPVLFTTLYRATADTPYSWAIFAVAAGAYN